jgi:hypothetical protein
VLAEMHNLWPTRHSSKLIKQGRRLGKVGSNIRALLAEYTNKRNEGYKGKEISTNFRSAVEICRWKYLSNYLLELTYDISKLSCNDRRIQNQSCQIPATSKADTIRLQTIKQSPDETLPN